MSSENLISKIKELSDIDAALLRILSERKKLQGDFDQLSSQIEKLRKDAVALMTSSKNAKTSYDTETENVRVEREKLAARRRALSTLGNYKLQSAAAKEIDVAEQALSAHEDTLVKLLDSSEESEKLSTEKELELLDKEEQKSAMVVDMQPTLQTLSEREAKHQAHRDEVVKLIDPKDLAVYDGARRKLAPDTLSPIISGACDFCNLQTPPQMVIQVSAGNSLQKCRGCSRILYVPKEA